MHFQSFSEFWAMGGYGFFVWLSFGATYALLVALVAYSHFQQRQSLKQLADKLAREQRIKQYQESSS
ncbi:MAG: heme exporter protein CcmD [Chromatiaceae bacterium]|nr:heme exporter protein CcmD [Chromatiaceae bacterium]